MVAFALSAVVLLTLLSSCTEEPLQLITPPQEEHVPLSLPYDPAQGTNPYLTNSLVTHHLAGLLYTTLVTIDGELGANNLLAKAITADEDKLGYSIVINDDFTFEDGSAITANDVAASLSAARDSEYYGLMLQNIDSVLTDETGVHINLVEPDSFFYRLLTMPIIKSGEGADKNPSSSGIYRREGDALLLRNEEQEHHARIELVDLSSSTALADGINLGRISSLDVTYLPGFVPHTELLQVGYSNLNLLFLGFSPDSEFFSTSTSRRSLSAIIPRDEMIEDSYDGNAVATHCLFHPKLEMCDCTVPTGEPEIDSIKILYNGDVANRHTLINDIETEFAKYGITIKGVSADDEEHFAELIEQGEYDVYLAEVLLPQNLDFSYFIDEEVSSERLYSAYIEMKSSGESQDFCSIFSYDMPIVPILYEDGALYHADYLSGLTSHNSNPYHNILKVVYD